MDLDGPAPSRQPYRVVDRAIQAAKDTGADRIHPGYGFLGENAAFAQKVTDAGIIFIGPKPHAIEVMGNKLAAKEAVADFDVPMVPGISLSPGPSPDERGRGRGQRKSLQRRRAKEAIFSESSGARTLDPLIKSEMP